MMRKCITVLLGFFLVLAAWGQNPAKRVGPEADTIWKKIEAASAGVQHLSSDFIQTRQMSLLGESLVSEGKMYLDGGKLRWEYLRPYSYVFIMNGQKVLLKGNGAANVMDVKSNRVFSAITRVMMDSVTGRGLSGSGDCRTEIWESADGQVEAYLVPQRRDLRQFFSKVVLHFDKGWNVCRVDLLEEGGDRTEIVLKNTRYDREVDPALFAVD